MNGHVSSMANSNPIALANISVKRSNMGTVTNFIILTAIIEAIEGKSYYAVLDELFRQPLAMNHSFRPDSLPSHDVPKGYTLEAIAHAVEPEWEKSNINGAGCICSNSTDLLD
ncbi:MAG: CubicO group peptidase (beta-lactamase class C family) [Litorivivens sp.]|jgi:CubicO group peptidase (beta-lactamase class C family)